MNMKELRKSKKMTQAEFAKAIGSTGPVVSNIETGRVELSEKIREKVREAFGVELTAVEKVRGTLEKRTRPSSTRKAQPEIIIQSPFGGTITPSQILAKVGKADQVYVRVDENRAYWVKGEESGSVELW